ncbi:hypothetical protein CDL12_01733 [Handroanthus impetiginosus]|uniref:Uncharacterized protein n=1 Tax=Handroanthus impetiginosus TaxID=429701 RepID=A0A2G9I7C3_9LAMI|nr:hypothetical protein CDL12_01733 [Handroanthus impetiginosus]
MAKRFENHQIEVLKAALGESENLTKEKKNELAAATGLDQAIKLTPGNEAELKKELLESKKREAELQDENWRLKERITIAESDEQFAEEVACEWALAMGERAS